MSADEPRQPHARVRHLIDELRTPFRAFVAKFDGLRESKSAIASKFEQAFEAYVKDTGGNFLSFVRYLDPSVPADREGYRAHATFHAASYLRRINTMELPALPGSTRPLPLLQAFARFVALLNPSETVWRAFVQEVHWSSRKAKRVQALAHKLAPTNGHKQLAEENV